MLIPLFFRPAAGRGYSGSSMASCATTSDIGTTQDVADAVAFLATDQASFITGQTIWVDGGLFSKPQWPREYE